MLAGGLEKATSGKIFFEDQEISKMSEDEVSKIRRKNIGIVFQSFYLIPNYTAVENVALTLELNNLKNPNEQAKELLDRFRLKNRFNRINLYRYIFVDGEGFAPSILLHLTHHTSTIRVY